MGNDSTERILASLRSWIAHAPAGARLPSSRQLSLEHGASPVTVQKAMHQLNALGLIETRPGVGTFVRDTRLRPPVDYRWQTSALGAQTHIPRPSSTQRNGSADAIALHSGYPTRELLPGGLVRAALARAARSETAITRTAAAGLPELQAWFAAELAQATPAGISPVVARDVLVLSGSQSGLSSIFRTLVGERQPLIVESPTYWGAIVAAAQAGVTVVPVSTGTTGPDPDEIDRAFARTGARAFYAQPTFANPTGIQWDDERARAILDIARRRNAFIIEDDWAHDLSIDSDPHPLARLDDDGHVIYIRSLTKSVSPSLRVAAVIARGPARERIFADRTAETLYVSGVLQAAALDVVTQPAWRTHLRTNRPRIRARRDALVTGVRENIPDAFIDHIPAGGLNVWVRLPDSTDLERLVRDTANQGVLIAPGTEWFPAEASSPHIRLNFSGPDPERYGESTLTIGDALRSQ